MRRLFDEHKIRKTVDLNGKWKFKLDPDNVGKDEGWWKICIDGEAVIVPSCWNNELRLLNYEGAAWYQREFEITENDGCPDLIFNFDSVMTRAEVWVDDILMCEHYGAFTGFSFITSVSVILITRVLLMSTGILKQVSLKLKSFMINTQRNKNKLELSLYKTFVLYKNYKSINFEVVK